MKFNNIPLNLEILAEECSEVIHIKSKIMRFGLNYCHPEKFISNRECLTQEIGDVLALVDILIDNGLFTEEQLIEAKYRKREKLKYWYKKQLLISNKNL